MKSTIFSWIEDHRSQVIPGAAFVATLVWGVASHYTPDGWWGKLVADLFATRFGGGR